MSEQVLSLFAAKYGFLKELPIEKVRDFETYMLKTYKEKYGDLVKEIEEKQILSDELVAKLKDATAAILKDYKEIYGA